MKILGYSERGIINSLIFSIGEDKELMREFVKLINVPEIEEPNNIIIDYTILLEQSFSRFGDSDLIIILEYENPKDKRVLFIEGKVNTSNSNWNIQSQFNKYNASKEGENKIKPKNYWSNLFSQLHLKKLLVEKWNDIKNDNKFEINEAYLGKRKIGSNPVVLQAFELIKCCEKNAYFVGLIPSNESEIEMFKQNNKTGYHFLSWQKVHEFCQDHNLKKVLEIFDYNKGQIYKY
ncbi:hypothetical protein C8C83_3306 [Flavobacterium sp. 90]|uniref:hypothetical protein n=1 Tax=unclassified Flavobacterium TaxID=196869 RepID=UPI000EAD53C3|nr:MULTISPECIES: hypothetical protein [unclassified Flavobacterium]RKR11568.1 hypothetical protein C8C82_3617 [Flavobacterium sp. 81]TCK55349.1 hypothetical protein C8C83_3306 [Flavobacterium sp. 90]